MRRVGNVRLVHKGILLVSVPLVFEIVFVLAVLLLNNQAEVAAAKASAAAAKLEAVQQIVRDVVVIGKNCDGRALIEPGFNTMLCRQDLNHVVAESLDLSKSADLSTGQKRGMIGVAKTISEVRDQLFAILDVYDRQGPTATEPLMRATRKDTQLLMTRLATSDLFDVIDQCKKIVNESPKIQETNRAQMKLLLGIAIAANVALTIACALYFTRNIATRLMVVSDNSVRLAQGKPLQPLMNGHDEIASLDRVFHDMADALAEAERSKQEVINMVTHDLKTPLTTVSALIEMLELGIFGSLNDEGINQLKVVSKNVARMNSLIKELLEVEKLKSGMLEIECVDLSVHDLLSEALDSVRAIAEEKNINLALHASHSLEVYGDYERLMQVLINLLGNALKFSPSGSTITAAAFDENTMVRITVKDQGRGVPPEMTEAIFNKFQQTSRSDATAKGGTGLGLAICRSLIELHGGEIGCTSELGKGSTFFFTVPKATDTIQEKQPTTTTAAGPIA